LAGFSLAVENTEVLKLGREPWKMIWRQPFLLSSLVASAQILEMFHLLLTGHKSSASREFWAHSIFESFRASVFAYYIHVDSKNYIFTFTIQTGSNYRLWATNEDFAFVPWNVYHEVGEPFISTI
jgi:hypothetical protein